MLVTLNVLAFLFHTVLSFFDPRYQHVRQALGTRKTFFDDVRTLTRYMYFVSMDALLDFMIEGLELDEREPIPRLSSPSLKPNIRFNNLYSLLI